VDPLRLYFRQKVFIIIPKLYDRLGAGVTRTAPPAMPYDFPLTFQHTIRVLAATSSSPTDLFYRTVSVIGFGDVGYWYLT